MSNKQPNSLNSSKKSNNSNNHEKMETERKRLKFKPLKLSDTSKLGKTSLRSKFKRFSSNQYNKVAVFNSKLYNKLKVYFRKLVHKEVFVDGQEPPKFFSFSKRFLGLYIILFIYSFLLILSINIPDNPLSIVLMLGNPFIFSNTLIAFFLFLSIILNNDKLRVFLFEEKTVMKQVILYLSSITIFYIIFLLIGTSINFITYLLILSMIWLILVSTRFYMYSRKFSTKIEAKFIKKYSIPRYLVVLIVPFLILGILVILSLFYRSFLVFISLDFFGPIAPTSAAKIYQTEMRLIMPLIYFSLVMALLFIIFEIIFTRRRAETKRAGSFDNFTFSLIVLFLFFFQILQISVFLLLREETVTALKTTFGGVSSAFSSIFILEFIISMYFLYRIIKKTGKTLGWRILFFKRDGLILFCLASIFAQTLTRYALSTGEENQTLTFAGNILSFDKYIISVLMIIFLGLTLLIYYVKPHETSMFIRLQKEMVKDEEKNLEKIYKIVRSEYIRRGEGFPIEILERELIKATQLSKANVYSLIEQLAQKDVNIVITQKKQEFGQRIKYLDFVSVTEKFEKRSVAKKKAKKFLAEQLFETSLAHKSKTSRLQGDLNSEKASDLLIASLSSNYSKKQIDEQKIEKVRKEAYVKDELKLKLTEDLKNQIIEILKKEYMYRIENEDKDTKYDIPISQISDQIEMYTKINPGELYKILDNLSKTDIELTLVENPDEPEDKKIKFLPFADDNMNYSLANFRPNDYNKFRIFVTKNFIKSLKAKKEKRTIFQLKKDITTETESQKSWVELLNNLYRYYPLYTEKLSSVPNTTKLRNQLRKMEEAYDKKNLGNIQ